MTLLSDWYSNSLKNYNSFTRSAGALQDLLSSAMGNFIIGRNTLNAA